MNTIPPASTISTPGKVEYHMTDATSKLNWLRAAVLGANDGIVSIAGLVVGVAGATSESSIILMTGIAGILAGALSMAAGEYVSVSSSRDSERAMLEKERHELAHFPEQELEELTTIYMRKGLSEKTARAVAREFHEQDPFLAHADAELGINPNSLTDPWHAALASAGSFLVGALIPLIAVLLPPPAVRVPVAFIAVVVALAITGVVSARTGGANPLRATIRVVLGGILAMAITYGVGRLFHVSGV